MDSWTRLTLLAMAISLTSVTMVAALTPLNLSLIAPVGVYATNNLSPIAFIFNATDPGTLANCTLNIDNLVRNSTTSPVQGINTLSYAPGEGTHQWFINCADTGDNSNASETRYVIIDTTPPTVTLTAPANNTITPSTTINFTFTALELNSSLNNCTLIIDGTPNKTTNNLINGITNGIVTNLTTGSHIWSVNCTDTAGNIGNSATRGITINATANTTTPVITLIAPAGVYATNNLSPIAFIFNATDPGTLANCTLNIDNLVRNSTTSPVQGINTLSYAPGEGTHQWFINCADTNNNTNTSETRYATIDTTPPTVTLTAPANNTITPSTTINFTFTALELNSSLNNCTLIIDGTPNKTTNNLINGITNGIVTNLTTGSHIWSVNCTDTAGNTGQSGLFNLTIIITPFCGDDNIDAGEECDNGGANGVACMPAYGTNCTYCGATCQNVIVVGGFCGDTIINGNETCDNGGSNDACPATCSATCTLNSCGSSSSGSGGGGSNAASASGDVSQTWIDLSAEQTVRFQVNREDLSVTNITFTVKQTTTQLALSLSSGTGDSTPPPAPTGVQTYQTAQVTSANADAIGTGFTLSFKIDKTWLSQNQITTVILYRLENEAWHAYTPTQTGADANYSYYAASLPGLSVFLIGGKAAAPAPVPAPTNMTTKNTTPVPVNVTPNSTEHNWTLSKPMPAPQEPSLLIWLLLGTLTVLVLGGLVLAFRRHKAVPAKVHSHYSLREYIEVCRKKGLTLEEIKERLLQAGWKEEVIGPVLAEYAQK